MLTGTLRVAFAAVLAIIALVLQLALHPLVAADSYQLFLAAVAVSVYRGGFGSGAITLLFSAVFKYVFFLRPEFLASARNPDWLLARLALFLAVGLVICWLGGRLKDRCESLRRIKPERLDGILRICACCKRIRDSDEQWCEIESYIRDHSHAQFSHGLCPRCADELYPELSTSPARRS